MFLPKMNAFHDEIKAYSQPPVNPLASNLV